MYKNENMVTATRSPRVANRNRMLTGNRVIGKVTMLPRAVMVDPTEGMARVLFNM